MKKQLSRRTIIFIIIAVIIWLVTVPIRLIGSNCLEYYHLQHHGVATKAHVTLLEPNNHQSVHYTYTVKTVEYSGTGRAGFGNPEFNSLSPGMELEAYYLPSSPKISCLGTPHALLSNDAVPFLAFLMLVSFVLAYQFRKALSRVAN